MKISIQNLKQGISKYSDTISPDFVEEDYKENYPFNFQVSVLLDKIEKDYRLKVDVKYKARFSCDRCLKDFEQDCELKQEQIYKIASVSEITDEDTVNLAIDATEIDISDVLNEIVVINHPLKKLCSEDCKGLCVKCGADLNETKCQCAEIQTDPRWDTLRKLIK